MLVQIEVTTRCNFDCFYCAGRDMAQRDMPMEQYSAIMDSHLQRFGVPETVSLQGEGEPTLNKSFFAMAAHVRSIGSKPYTITNGTYKYPEHFADSFSEIGVSVDTLDAAEASRIGRHNLERVLEFVDAAAALMPVIIHTVALSPAHLDVAAWCKERGYRHVVQPLQAKDDYQQRYPQRVHLQRRPIRYQCRFLEQDLMRYSSIDGVELPCAFIKDTSAFISIAQLRQDLSQRRVPRSCAGCQCLV